MTSKVKTDRTPRYRTGEGYGKFAVSTESGEYTTLTMDPMLQDFLVKIVGIEPTRHLVRLFAKEKHLTRSRSRHVAHQIYGLLFKNVDNDRFRKTIINLLVKEFGESAVADMKPRTAAKGATAEG